MKREYNDSNIRGTIDVSRHLRFNYPANGRIAYRTREFSYDNYVTQLIRHTIEHVARHPMGAALLSESKEMEECVRNIVQNTPSYQKSAKRTVMADNCKVVSRIPERLSFLIVYKQFVPYYLMLIITLR